LGERVAGLSGAIVASVAFIMPPGLLVFTVGRVWQRLRGRPWLRDVQAGLTAVTVGLVGAAALLLAQSAAIDLTAWLVVIVAAIVLLRTRLHPLWILAAGALIGAAGFI